MKNPEELNANPSPELADGRLPHRNTFSPEREAGANAYTSGADIHMGQQNAQQHAAHEGWHVIQQEPGRH